MKIRFEVQTAGSRKGPQYVITTEVTMELDLDQLPPEERELIGCHLGRNDNKLFEMLPDEVLLKLPESHRDRQVDRDPDREGAHRPIVSKLPTYRELIATLRKSEAKFNQYENEANKKRWAEEEFRERFPNVVQLGTL